MKRICLIFVALLTFIPIMKVDAAERPDTITYSTELSKDYVFRSTDGDVLYALDAFSGERVHKNNFNLEYVEEADYGLNYILSNGYPNKNIVDNNYIDYSITQYAILLYLMDEGYINNGKDDMDDNFEEDYDEFLKFYESLANQPEYAEIYNKINELVTDAKEYKENYIEEIYLENENNNLTLSADGQYYESSFMKVDMTNAKTFNIEFTNAPESAFTVDRDGNKKTEFNIDDEFQIKIPVNDINSESIRFKIKVVGEVSKFYLYKSIDRNLEPESNTMNIILDDYYTDFILTTPYTEEFEVEKELFLNVEPGNIVFVPATGLNNPITILITGFSLIIIAVLTILGITKYKKVKNK